VKKKIPVRDPIKLIGNKRKTQVNSSIQVKLDNHLLSG